MGSSPRQRSWRSCFSRAYIRNQLIRASGPRDDSFGEGMYSEGNIRKTYLELAERGRKLLDQGASVILDATFSRKDQRELFREAARSAGAQLVSFECRTPGEIAAARMRHRRLEGSDVSDRTAAIQVAQAEVYEPYGPGESIPLDTTGSPDLVLKSAIKALRDRLADGASTSP